jgi:hypothetical protein
MGLRTIKQVMMAGALLFSLPSAAGCTRPPVTAFVPHPTTTYVAHNIFESPDCPKQQSLDACAQRAANVAGIPVAWSQSPRGFHLEVMSAIWEQKGQAHEQWQRGALSLVVNSGVVFRASGRVVRDFTWDGSRVVVNVETTPQHLPRWRVTAAWSYQGRPYDVGASELTLDPASAGPASKWQNGLAAVIGLFRTLRYATPS